MNLEIKRPDNIVPSYSLTGDLLSYLRCRLQYRYHNGSALPPSRPVQLWFGEFLHGTLELAFKFWQSNKAEYPLPWPCTPRPWQSDALNWPPNDIGKFAHLVEVALSRQGKQARSSDTRNSAYQRVEAAINQLGPNLFPLIASAEKKVIGTRLVPQSTLPLRASKYELHGVIDVLTNITLGEVSAGNLIRELVSSACPELTGDYEVIVDYKGAERPRMLTGYWNQGDWQVQTYAWLRSRQPDALPVAAGILVYINELTPGDKEMQNLKTGLADGSTDVIPDPASSDEQLIRLWMSGNDTGALSPDFRLRRAIRVVPITEASRTSALGEFDSVVRRIEEDIFQESVQGNILQSWSPSCRDADTCVACDFRHFCPWRADSAPGYTPSAPTYP